MLQDLRFALRSLSRSPLFTLGALAALAVGIGANSTIFALSNAMLFRPAPGIAHPEQLVWVSGAWRDRARPGGLSYPDYRDYRDAAQAVLSDILAFRPTPLSLGSGGAPERLRGQLVTGSFFTTLGVQAAAGRLLGSDDDRVRPTVVLSHRLWERRFGASADILDQPIVVNGHSLTVVGVAPPLFIGAEIGEAADLWIPLSAWADIRASERSVLADRGAPTLTVLGRLREGVSIGAAQSALASVAARLEQAYPDTNEQRTVVLTSADSSVSPANRGELMPLAALLLAVTSLVLLIACANVANLLLARGAGRSAELGIRTALGASRGRLVRQLLIESSVLAAAGSAAGLLLSFWASDLLLASLPAADFEGVHTGTDLRVLGFTAIAAMLSVVVFGLVPALSSTRRPFASGSGSTGAVGRRSRLQGAFVVAQMSLSLVLLLAAGLSLRAMQKAQSVDLGFDPRQVLTASYDLVLQNYPDERRQMFRRELVSQLEATQGVTAVAIANLPPMTGTMIFPRISAGGEAIERRVSMNAVGPRYFHTLNIPIAHGREFTDSDGRGAPAAAIVNDTLARQIWGSSSALGQRLRLDGDSLEVVGVARDAKYDEPTEPAQPFLYVPIAQRSPLDRETVMIRSTAAARATTEQVLAVLRGLDPALPAFDVRPLDDIVRQRPDKQRAFSVLFASFGLAALSLASLGVYGVMAYTVTLRRREMGVRLALGASPAQLTHLVVGDALTLAFIGVGIGSALALPVAQILGALLFGIQIGDLAAFAAACALLIAVALVASLLPARRASKLDPMIALRTE